MTPVEHLRDEAGVLPSFTSIGSYPIVYATRNGCEICPDCANKNVTEYDDPAVSGDVYYEGQDLACDDCGRAMPSAYGDPYEDEYEDEDED